MNSRLLTQSLLAGSIVMIGANVVGRLIGYAREALIAGYFGTDITLDTFLLAFTIPELLFFVLFAAVPTVLIPMFKRMTVDDHESESSLFWNGLFGLGAVLALISVGLYVFREQLLYILAPTLSGEERSLALSLAAILAPIVFFRGLESYARGWLFYRKHFVVPATTAMLMNVVILVVLYAMQGSLGIESLAWAWLLGAVAACIFNIAFAVLAVGPTGLFALKGDIAARLLRLVLVVGAVESIALLYPTVDRMFASRYLGEGQISALRYAVFLIHILTGMFVVAFGSASFPWITDLSVTEQRTRLVSLYSQSVRLIVFVLALVALGVIMFAPDIVQVSFMRGEFDERSLQLTTSPLIFYALGVLFYSVYLFQMRFYYARLKMWRLGVLLLSLLGLKVVLSTLLVEPMHHDGLALATSIAWFVGAVVMTLDLGRQLSVSLRTLLVPAVFKITAALVVTGICWYGLQQVWPHDTGRSLWSVFGRLVVMGATGVIVYTGSAFLLKLPEPRTVVERIVSTFKRA